MVVNIAQALWENTAHVHRESVMSFVIIIMAEGQREDEQTGAAAIYSFHCHNITSILRPTIKSSK